MHTGPGLAPEFTLCFDALELFIEKTRRIAGEEQWKIKFQSL
jgi:hypothetical protein